ncbi:MAG: hypothetical protein M3P85_11480 [Actinomycetota bacterium]|nr:hypothetical protein [Actinomycetota bacterium]
MTSPDEGPEWADEAHLDEVFSTWVPGPPDSAPAAEREMAGDSRPVEIPPEEAISEHDMEAALAAALAEAEGTAGPAPQPSELSQPSQPSNGSEPRSPAWLNLPTAEDPPGPRPVPASPPTTANPVVEPEPDPRPDAHAFEPAPPPAAEPAEVARPWTRSDDDVLPGRRGKSRRR